MFPVVTLRRSKQSISHCCGHSGVFQQESSCFPSPGVLLSLCTDHLLSDALAMGMCCSSLSLHPGSLLTPPVLRLPPALPSSKRQSRDEPVFAVLQAVVRSGYTHSRCLICARQSREIFWVLCKLNNIRGLRLKKQVFFNYIKIDHT